MPDNAGVLDNILQITETTASEKPKRAVTDKDSLSTSSEKTASANTSKNTKPAMTGAASSPAKQTSVTGALGLVELNQKIDQLATMMKSIAPVVKELKTAYDAAKREDDPNSTRGEEEKNAVGGEPPAKKGKSDDSETPVSVLVDDLVQEVTEDEQTDKPLNEKISVVDSILASGLNEQVQVKRKEKIKRPENCKLLQVTRVNSEIWDIAQKTARSMDGLLQKIQESLVKGLTPIARLTGTMGEVLEKGSAMPTQDELWESLSNSVLLIASATHDLNMCRRDLFKVDLDETYKAICSSKQPVGSQFFGDDLADRLKTVKESKKAAQQLTGHKRKRSDEYSRPSYSYRAGHFLFNRQGHYQQGHPQRRSNYNQKDSRTTTQKGKKTVQQK